MANEPNPLAPEDQLEELQLSSTPEPANPSVIDGLGLEDAPSLPAVMDQAFQTNPQEFAGALKAAERTGAPLPLAEQDPAFVKRMERIADLGLEDLPEDAPAVAAFLSDYRNATVAQDDIDLLRETEKTLRSLPAGAVEELGRVSGGFGSLLEAGGSLVERGLNQLPDSVVKLLGRVEGQLQEIAGGYKPSDLLTSAGEGYKASADDIRGFDRKTESTFATDVSGALGGLITQLATGFALGKTGATSTFFASGADQQADRQKESGTYGTTPLSEMGLFLGGATTAAAERVGFDLLLERLPPSIKDPLIRRASDLILAGGIEAAQEVVEAGLQAAVEAATTNKDAVAMDDPLYEGGVAATVGAIARAVVQAAMPGRAGAYRQTEQDLVEIALKDSASVDQLAQLAQNSSMRESSPERYRQLLQSMGGNDTSVFLDGAQSALLLSGKTRAEIDADPVLSLIRDGYEAVRGTGADVRISATDFMEKVAPSPMYDELRPLMTLRQDTAVPFRQEQAAGEQGRQIDRLVAQAQQNAAAYAEAQEIFDTVKDQLADTGRYSERDAGILARVVPAWAVSYAERNGTTVREAFANSGLKIEGPMTGRRQQLSLYDQGLFDQAPDVQSFLSAVERARSMPRGGAIAAQTEDSLAGARLFLGDEGRVGFAVKPDGELVSVFKSPESSVRNAIDSILPAAIRAGATKLDVYDGPVKAMYERYGFKETERLQWDDQYAPENWDYETQGRPDVVLMELQGDGRDFGDFFSRAASGETGVPFDNTYRPQNPAVAEELEAGEGRYADYHAEYSKHTGNFDDHIALSIPAYRDHQYAIGTAILDTFGPGSTMLDVGASQGSQAKTIAALSGGNISVVALDPNRTMAQTFDEISQVPGASYSLSALGMRPQDTGVAWEEEGVQIPYFDPAGQKFDVVQESMVFQFIDRNRPAHVARMAELVKDDGLVILQEKVITADWEANEKAKNTYKAMSFRKEDLDAKAAEVLEGMNKNMVTDEELEALLREKFEYVEQIWDSGNFKGYAASNSRERMAAFSSNLPDTRTPYDTRAVQGDLLQQVPAGREADGSLRGLPRVRNASVFKDAVQVADRYMASKGWVYEPPAAYAKVDEERARRIAAEFDKMEHAPQDPEVKAAYDAMIQETLDQYRAILKTGLKVEFIDFAATGDPYAATPRMATEDVRENNHLWVFSTREGFGSDDTFDPLDNPLLQETEFTDANGKPMLANDIFRVVHDYFGHVKEGVGFRADGEENAWRAHAAMYSPLARRAMTTETRGQNSWVNFGPYGETNRTAGPADTHFADQKIGLLPEWVSEEGRTDDEARALQSNDGLLEQTLGMFSAAARAARTMNLPQWKKADGSATLKDIMAKLVKEPGVRKEELEWSGLNNLVQIDPTAKYTREEFASLVEAGMVQLDEVVAVSEKPLTWDEDIDTDDSNWEFMLESDLQDFDRARSVDDLLDEFGWVDNPSLTQDYIQNYIMERLQDLRSRDVLMGDDLWRMESLDDAIEAGDDARVKSLTEKLVRSNLSLFRGEFAEVMTDLRQSEYLQDPVRVWKSGEFEIRLARGEYVVYRNDEMVDTAYNLEDARQAASDYLRGDADPQKARHVREEYQTPGEYENLREIKIKNPAAHAPFTHDTHYGKEENVLLYLRVQDRNIVDADGNETSAFFLDEFQSDWHQQGRRDGYYSAEELAQLDAMEKELDDLQGRMVELSYLIESEARPVLEADPNDPAVQPGGDLYALNDAFGVRSALTPYSGNEVSPVLLSTLRTLPSGPEIVELATGQIPAAKDRIKAIKLKVYDGVPDVPFKGEAWQELGLKRALMHAAQEGKDAFAFPTADVLAARWSENYRTLYENLYDRSMVKIVKKLTGETPARVQGKEPGQEYHIIPMTPELREKILKESFALFQPARGEEAPTARGYYDPDNALIRLTEASDLSTFLHEFAHFMYEVEPEDSQIRVDTKAWHIRQAESVAREANEYLTRKRRELEQSAFHGSGVEFTEFNMDKVGTGEGQLAYGWGLYFTSGEDLAAHYARSRREATGKGLVYETEIPEQGDLLLADATLDQQPEKYRSAMERLLQEFSPKRGGREVTVDGEQIDKRDPRYQAAILIDRVGFDAYLARQMQAAADFEANGDMDGLARQEELLAAVASMDGAEIAVSDGPAESSLSNTSVIRLYNQMVIQLGSQKAASERMAQAGIPGLSYRGPLGSTNFVVWDPSVVSITNVTEQQQDAELFTQMTSVPGGKDGEVTAEDARTYFTHGSTGNPVKDSALRVAGHEQFARAWETYLMEGRAPSIELRSAFRKFAQWLTQIYRSVRGDLRVTLDDGIRKVFDRLVATEDQIAVAQARNKFEPLFTDATMAGMTEDEYAAYTERVAQTEEAVGETVREKVMNQIRRAFTKQWREERADLIDELTPVVAEERVYRAATQLRGALKLDKSAVKELVGEAAVSKKGTEFIRTPNSLRGMTESGGTGMHPDEAAGLLGYTSGMEMLRDIIDSPSLKVAVETAADVEMVNRHGDPFNDGSLDKMVEEALQSEARADLILAELRALTRGREETDRAAIKSLAEERIARLSFREIHPERFRKAEIKAAQEAARAMEAGNREGAAAAKTRQLLNFYLGSEATKARAAIEKGVERLARYEKKSVREAILKADGGHWDQIRKILRRFEFRKSATLTSVEAQNVAVQAWMDDRIKNHGDGLVLTPEILDETYRRHWKDVPFSELQGVMDSLRNIEHVARYSNKIRMEEEQRDFDAVVEDWTSRMERMPSVYEPKRTDIAEGQKVLPWAMAQMTKVPWLASWLDGGDRVGMSHDLLVQPFTDAYDESQKLWNMTGKVVMDAIADRTPEDRKRHAAKVFIPEIGDSLYGHQILAVALNVGNAGNLRKMLLGEGWADPDVPESISLGNEKLSAVLAHMQESDWILVQRIWDQMDLLYPKLADVHRRTTGLVPPKVEAAPVVTPYGTFSGGYYPVKYDPARSLRADELQSRADAETESMFGTSGIQASVTAGATNERTGYYDAIRLSLDVVPTHFQETIHYITHHDAVRATNRLIRDPRVAKAIKAKLGPYEYAQLRPWLNDIAKDGREAPTKYYWEKALQRLRFGATLGYMGFKVSTGVMQMLGWSNAAAEVGGRNMLKAFRTILRDTKDLQGVMDFAVENSKVMAYRTQTFDREVKNALAMLRNERGVLATAQELSMKHIALIQTYLVDLPTWYGAYIKELELSGDEAKAFKYADWVVENVHGSGRTATLASIMRSQKEADKMFTMFMTFFSALWNAERDLARGAKSGKYSVTDVGARVAFLFVLPVIGEMLLRGGLFDEEEEEGERLEEIALKMALYPVSSVPFVRDVASGVAGGFGYNLSPVGALLETGVTRLPQVIEGALTGEEVSAATMKGAFVFTGAALGVPGTTQAWGTLQHLYEVAEEGEELTIRELLYGPVKK